MAGTPTQPSQSWVEFTDRFKRQCLMDEMMVVQHVDILAAVREGDGFVKARANCRSCTCAGVCREWFLDGSPEEAEFCPNLGFFAGLKSAPEKA